MAGVANDYLIYPIMDLIKQKQTDTIIPFEGEPSVTLIRDDPNDIYKITGVKMYYKSGYEIDVTLKYGTFNPLKLPLGVNSLSSDYEFYLTERLDEVFVSYLEPSGNVIEIYNIQLNYDENGLLQDTVVNTVDV